MRIVHFVPMSMVSFTTYLPVVTFPNYLRNIIADY